MMDRSAIETIVEQAGELAASGQIDRAGMVLEEAAASHPDSVELLSHLGYFYYKTGRFGRAWNVLQKRAELAEADAGIAEIMAEIAISRRDFSSAVQCLRCAEHDQKHTSNNYQTNLHKYIIYSKLQKLIKCTFSSLNRIGFKRSVLGMKWILMNNTGLAVSCLEAVIPKRSKVFSLSSFLRFLSRYDSKYLNENFAYHKTREAIIASQAFLSSAVNASVLDIGTGQNSLPLYWASRGLSVHCLDGSDYGFPHLKSVEEKLRLDDIRPKVHYINGDARRLPFENNRFDGVSVLCALEHIPQDGDIECMKEIFRVLKPGGVAVVTIETAQHDSEQWLEAPYEIGYQTDERSSQVKPSNETVWQEFFCRNYSPEQMRKRLAESSEWEITEEGFYDDGYLPIRRWLDPFHRSPMSSLLRAMQPLLSLLFYRRKQISQPLTPSSIGYLILRKPLNPEP